MLRPTRPDSPWTSGRWAARQGWPVIPLHSPHADGCTCANPTCGSPGKHPRTRNGLHDATTSTPAIDQWSARWPEANVGIRTGNGLLVLDIDGPQGESSLRALEQQLGPLPNTTTVTTGNGRHLYFSTHPATEIRNSAGKLGPGLDVRGTGGYVVAAGSRHHTGARYEATGPDQPTDLPGQWLVHLAQPPTRRPTGPTERPTPSRGVDAYVDAAIAGETDRVRHATEGNRNNTLNVAAYSLGQLVGADALDEALATYELHRAAADTGLDDREALATIASGLSAGRENPRTIPPPPDPQPKRPPQLGAETTTRSVPATRPQRAARMGGIHDLNLWRHGNGWRWTVTDKTGHTTTWRTDRRGRGLERLDSGTWTHIQAPEQFALSPRRNEAIRSIYRLQHQPGGPSRPRPRPALEHVTAASAGPTRRH